MVVVVVVIVLGGVARVVAWKRVGGVVGATAVRWCRVFERWRRNPYLSLPRDSSDVGVRGLREAGGGEVLGSAVRGGSGARAEAIPERRGYRTA